MSNKFSSLSEEELIQVLNQGNLSEEEFAELLKAMEEKGLKGMIMPVSDIDSPEDQAMKEYIEYHKKLKTRWSKPEVDEFIEILSDTNTTLESKRKAIVSLAHIPKLEAFEALKKYNQEPDEELKVWSQMALEECCAFLEADILEEDKISVSSLAGKKNGKLRFYLVLLAKNLTHWLEGDEKLLENVISKIINEENWEIEDVEMGEYFFIVTTLHGLDEAPAELIELIIKELNCDRKTVQGYYMCINTHKPTKEEIDNWREEIKMQR